MLQFALVSSSENSFVCFYKTEKFQTHKGDRDLRDALVERWFTKNDNDYIHSLYEYSQVRVNTVVTELFSAMIRHRVRQDASFSSVILSVLVVESLGRHLDPKIDIFTEILPFVVSSTIYGVWNEILNKDTPLTRTSVEIPREHERFTR